MSNTVSSVQAGVALLAAALRDPAPIVKLETFWGFMKVVEEACRQLPDCEKVGSRYQAHVECYDRIYKMRFDMRPVDNDQMELGEQIGDAMIAYTEQVVNLLPLLLDQGDIGYQTCLRQEFVEVLDRVVRDIEEVPGGPEVQTELATFRMWRGREHADLLYEQALDLFDQRHYAEALARLGHALRLEPDRAHLYLARGDIRAMMKEYRGAAAEYQWALRCAPYSFEAAINLGCVYEALERPERSLVACQKACSLEPDQAIAHYNLGGAYHALGLLDEALEAFTTAIALDPACADAYLYRGTTLSRLERHQEALADYDQALALSPDDTNNAWTVCWAHFGRVGLGEVQVAELERVAQLDHTHYTSHCCRAVLALHRSDPQAALLHLEQAVAQAPRQWDPHFWVGVVAALEGETEIARHAIEYAVDLGLPPMLLTPLAWPEVTHSAFYEQYGHALLSSKRVDSEIVVKQSNQILE